ncbi:transcription factor domain-containing protein [Aspergillus novofumigatus IBT 16806]|uniref:transcription factor domain-containing protein n=1 Tax=Aspergillus novofumigatus (strain IBT 16806) TaxID=1392255 RepID=UPI000CC86DAD|nr:putative fungal-specific transcription factor [Aspergillus novofumigatus IBT 16806]PKX92297.1 putative fungal-specific transcription factor [Aspergillus novofumigatus IBT 16806]
MGDPTEDSSGPRFIQKAEVTSGRPHVSSAFPICPHHPRPIASHRIYHVHRSFGKVAPPQGLCEMSAAKSQCVPATLTPRRRRFQERVLLDRLRHYEGLLRQHNIYFEPLHPQAKQEPVIADVPRDCERSETARAQTPVQSQAVDLWQAISRVTLEPEDDDGDSPDVQADGVENAWDHHVDQPEANDQTGDDLLFGQPQANVNVLALHPEQAQIFRLWQTYLENVNPLLKVTHTPTLQPRIVDAVSDLGDIHPTLEALMFSIYCIAVMSLADNECHRLLKSSKEDLLARYRLGCRQVLIKCRPWQFTNVDGLTAVYLYLVSVSPQTDPRSLSSMLAAALRIAQRMGLHNESTYTRYTAVEAEMRRRLWWSLVIFDHRMCEMSDYKVTTLTPTWDCRIPLNKPTEALFAVVRSELADLIRHTTFHINFVNPVLAAVAKAKDPGHVSISADGEMLTIQRAIEEKYLAFCDPADPLHFMTIWTTRGYLARNRLLEHYARHLSSPAMQQTDAQRNAALSYALEMLECDTRLRVSPLTCRYRWLVDFHVPALAYIHVLNDLRKRPTESHAGKAWQAMSENYEARAMHPKPSGQGVFTVFARVVLQAWGAREIFLRQRGMPVEAPQIVLDIRSKVGQTSSGSSMVPSCSTGEPSHSSIAISAHSEAIPAQMNFTGHSADGQAFPGPDLGPSSFPDVAGPPGMDIDIDQFWTAMDWRLMHTQAW